MDFLRDITGRPYVLSSEGRAERERERGRENASSRARSRDKIYMRASIGNISMVYNQLRVARRAGGCESATAAISGHDARRRFRLQAARLSVTLSRRSLAFKSGLRPPAATRCRRSFVTCRLRIVTSRPISIAASRRDAGEQEILQAALGGPFGQLRVS